MGVRIGGHVGPVSASVPASGCGGPVLGMLVLFAALGALYEYWQWVLAGLGVLLAALAIGCRIYAKYEASRKARAAHFSETGEPPQAAVSDRR